MKRIFHPWDKWEDFKYNFYGGMKSDFEPDSSKVQYAEMLRNLSRFESALKRIVVEWEHSCEHNLSNKALNRIAYLGQAACAIELGVPHQVSMSGYNLLTPEEQVAADAMAQKYLDIWMSLNETIQELRNEYLKEVS